MKQPGDNPKQSHVTLSNKPELENTDDTIIIKSQTADKPKQSDITKSGNFRYTGQGIFWHKFNNQQRH